VGSAWIQRFEAKPNLIARALGMTTLAEGIETAGQHEPHPGAEKSDLLKQGAADLSRIT